MPHYRRAGTTAAGATAVRGITARGITARGGAMYRSVGIPHRSLGDQSPSYGGMECRDRA